jgi:hypothetical protein
MGLAGKINVGSDGTRTGDTATLDVTGRTKPNGAIQVGSEGLGSLRASYRSVSSNSSPRKSNATSFFASANALPPEAGVKRL